MFSVGSELWGSPTQLTIPMSPRSRMKYWSEEMDLADENLSTADESDELLAFPWELIHGQTHTHTQHTKNEMSACGSWLSFNIAITYTMITRLIPFHPQWNLAQSMDPTHTVRGGASTP